MLNSLQNLGGLEWVRILGELGFPSSYLDGKHHGCPLCHDGKDRFRFSPETSNGLYICNQCSSGNAVHLLSNYLNTDYQNAQNIISEHLGIKVPTNKKIFSENEKLLWAIDQEIKTAKNISNDTVAFEYLKFRKLSKFIPIIKDAKFNSFVKDNKLNEYIVYFIRDADGKVCHTQKTFIRKRQDSFSKQRIISKGSIPKGAAIRLLEPSGGIMGVCEGVETALACFDLYDIPTWSCLNTSILSNFIIPKDLSIDKLVIFCDNDKNFSGQAASYTLAKKMSALNKNLTVEVIVCPLPGKDFDDYRKIKFLRK
jgi:putative DNA primase/helicase